MTNYNLTTPPNKQQDSLRAKESKEKRKSVLERVRKQRKQNMKGQ